MMQLSYFYRANYGFFTRGLILRERFRLMWQ